MLLLLACCAIPPWRRRRGRHGRGMSGNGCEGDKGCNGTKVLVAPRRRRPREPVRPQKESLLALLPRVSSSAQRLIDDRPAQQKGSN